MNPQGMEEHKTRGLKRLALTRLRAPLPRGGAAGRPRDRHRRGHARRGAAPPGRGPARRWSCCRTASTRDEIGAAHAADAARRRARGAAGAARAPSRCSCRWAGSRRYKGFGDVAAALDAAARAGRAAAALGLGGGRAADRLRVARGALPAALDGHVHLAGRVRDELLHALYARADVFVHATRFEGSSLVTLEAMAHGAAGGGHARGRHPRQGRGRRDRPAGGAGRRARRSRDGLARAGADARDEAPAPGRARPASARSSASPGRVLVERTIALYEELLRGRAVDGPARERPWAASLALALCDARLIVVVTGSTSLVPGLAPVGPIGFRSGASCWRRAWCWPCVVAPRTGGRPRPGSALLLLPCPRSSSSTSPAARINGDGVMYYVYVRSLVKDARPRLHERVHALRAGSSASDLRVPTTHRAAALDLRGRARRWSGPRSSCSARRWPRCAGARAARWTSPATGPCT